MKSKNDMDLNELISYFAELYFSQNSDAPRIPVNMILTEDMNKTHLEIRPDLADLISDTDNSYNGRMVAPHSLENPIFILLNLNKVLKYTEDRTLTWVGTIGHELTHAVDYYEMARKTEVETYDSLQDLPDFTLFQLWSEYHARKKGYKFLLDFHRSEGNVRSDEEEIQYILKTEWPYHIRRYFSEYYIYRSDGFQQLYITMQLLGRYSVWCDMFPDTFNATAIARDFVRNPWMEDLFDFLYSHETLEEVFPCFDEFKAIIKQNWPTIQ